LPATPAAENVAEAIAALPARSELVVPAVTETRDTGVAKAAVAASAPAVEPPPRMPVVEAIAVARDLPPVSLTLPPESGLELVETRFHPAPVVDEPAPPAPRRARPPRREIPQEPLQYVETRKDQPPGH
jgi:hypothetical protein